MYGYYILQDQNPALLERHRLRNKARMAAFYAAIGRQRRSLARLLVAATAGVAHGIDFLKTHIRTSLLSRKPPLSTFDSSGRWAESNEEE